MSPINRIPLQSEIIEFVKQYIEINNLKEGDRLPSQAELMDLIGVSRSTLREAIKTLEAKNILNVVNGKGIFVNNSSPNIISAQIEFRREKESILELLEVRKILEHEIIHLVIQKASDDELDEIEKILRIIMDKYHRGQKQNVEDRQFHHMIYNSCHNRVINQLILSIDDLLNKLWDFPFGMGDPFTCTIPLHEELFNNIRKRNVKKAQMVNDKIIHMICEDIKGAK
jgi:GntR family transcriptional regulator, transcriptional repressor for pyruvate dehydrogenase complex